MKKIRTQTCAITVFNSREQLREAFKLLVLSLILIFTASCKNDKSEETEPEPAGQVYSFRENNNGNVSRIYTEDSLIVLGVKNAEFIFSVRAEDLKKGNNVRVKTPLFDLENIDRVTNGIVMLKNYNQDTEIEPVDKKYIGFSGKDKLEKAKIVNMGIIGTRRNPTDGHWASITMDDVLGITKLLSEPVALIGETAKIGDKTFNLQPTN